MFVSEDTSIIDVGMFGSAFVLIDTKDKFDFLVSNNEIDCDIPEWDTVNGFCSFFMGGDGAYFVLGLKDKTDISVMFHEIIHMAHFIMDYKGIPIGVQNSEIEAYLAQSILENLFEHCKAKKSKKKKKKKGKKE